MKFLKSFALFLTVIAGATLALEHTCKWKMDVLEMVKDSQSVAVFRPHQNVIAAGSSYFVRLRISCENQVNPFLARSLLLTGYTPVVKLHINGYGLDSVMNTSKVMYSEGALVQFRNSSRTTELEGNFLIMDNSGVMVDEMPTNCTQGVANNNQNGIFETEENVLSPHCNETHLCDVSWLVPLTVAAPNVVIKCFLTNPHEIQDESLTVHSSGFIEPDGNEIGEIITTFPDGITVDDVITVNNVPLEMPFWLVDGFKRTDYSIFTDSEFERLSFIKVNNISQSGLSKVCSDPCFSIEIRGSLLLPDRILLSTCFGIQELRKELGSSYQSKLVLRECIRKMVAPPQAFPVAIKTLAIQESSAKVFVSDVLPGISMEFFELRDKTNRSLCEFLASNFGQQDCTIQDASMNLIPSTFYVFLVSYSLDYYVVGYSNNQWEIRYSFPSSLPNVSRGDDEHEDHWTLLDSSTSGSLPVYLSGLSFTRNTGSNLFVWGNVLLYSPNAGENFFWLRHFNQESNITVFTSAADGSYAFLTDTQQVWWGHTDSAAVHHLETANEWNIGVMTSHELASCVAVFSILSLFYDTSGQLWKVIQCQNQTSSTPCIFRSKVVIQDILSHSQLIHEQTFIDDDISNLPLILDDGSTSTVPKHCLKYSIFFQAPYTSHYLQHIVDVIDVPYMVNTVPVSVAFLEEYLDNQRASLNRPNIVEMSDMNDALPEYIYLMKGETYNFTVTMSLDSDLPNHTFSNQMKVLSVKRHKTGKYTLGLKLLLIREETVNFLTSNTFQPFVKSWRIVLQTNNHKSNKKWVF